MLFGVKKVLVRFSNILMIHFINSLMYLLLYILIISGRRKRTLHLYVVTATNLGLRSSDLEPTQRRRTACDTTSWWWLRALWAVVKSFYMGW